MAGLDEFIEAQPDRYETTIGEGGVALSGGQRQRLALARAVLGDPEILIFDEATSQLDARTEAKIQARLNAYLKGKTVILVAHRLSTIRNADWIYVMDKGKLVEANTHEELLKIPEGVYAAYWHSQVGERREEHAELSESVAKG